MKITILFYLIIFLTFQSCQISPAKDAEVWSKEIKRKIIEDANQKPTKVIVDSVHNTITYFNLDIKLKSYQLFSQFDSASNKVYSDTIFSIFYSTDQTFELVREPCPGNDRSFEGIRYKGKHFGLAEFKYCDGKIKERGFRYNNNEIGTWIEYDSLGNVISTRDKGRDEILNKLTTIKYYR